MAGITERKHPSGRVTFKVTLRKKGSPVFIITFDDLDEAVDWVEKNEKLYHENPDKYFKWREEIYYKMHRGRQRSYNHILRPKMNFPRTNNTPLP